MISSAIANPTDVLKVRSLPGQRQLLAGCGLTCRSCHFPVKMHLSPSCTEVFSEPLLASVLLIWVFYEWEQKRRAINRFLKMRVLKMMKSVMARGGGCVTSTG